LNPVFRRRIINRHSDSLKRYGYHPNALYWSNADIQALRFKVLAEIGVESGQSVIDVGCGFADLCGWFSAQSCEVSYTGIDISPDLIEVARQRHPDVKLFVGELFDGRFLAREFDWVLLSGALNEPYHDQGKYAKKVIREMYRISRLGVAYNLLNSDVVRAPDLQSFSPSASLSYAQEQFGDASLRTDYLDNDFTIYLYKKS